MREMRNVTFLGLTLSGLTLSGLTFHGNTAQSGPPYYEARNVSWTYFYGKTDSYERIDYILVSCSLDKSLVKENTYIPSISNWGIGSDHWPIVAEFETDIK